MISNSLSQFAMLIAPFWPKDWREVNRFSPVRLSNDRYSRLIEEKKWTNLWQNVCECTSARHTSNMYFIVKLNNSGGRKIVPFKWINSLQLCRLLKYGVAYESKKVYTVFISPTSMDEEPDFTLDILQQLDNTRNACYAAHIFSVFGKKSIKKYQRKWIYIVLSACVFL